MTTNLLNFDSQEQRRKVIQCHFCIKLCGISRSKAAFCIQAMKWSIGVLAKMCYATVTAEMLTDIYPKVLSILQAKTRGKSASTSADDLLPTPKLKIDTVAEDTCIHVELPQPPQSSLPVVLFWRKKMRQITLLPLLFPYWRTAWQSVTYLFTSVLGICTPITRGLCMSSYATLLKALILFFILEGNSNTCGQIPMALHPGKSRFYFF